MLSNFNPVNEPVLNYAPGSPEREALKKALAEAKSSVKDIPMVIDGKEIHTNKKVRVFPPHEHAYTLGYFHEGDEKHVYAAIESAQRAKDAWASMTWQKRAEIFLRAADLISESYRYKINAATMLGQSKNAYQAEIDSACEMADFLRFNVKYLTEIYRIQPSSSEVVINELEYRPLEGFVFALTPFNFTAIAGNLPAAPALMGNTIVWKPAYQQIYSAQILMEIFMAAGLPDGVINMIFVDGPLAGEIIFKHKDFGGIHFTGSTNVFRNIWKTIGNHIHIYKSYPKIVGETGGKDFIIAHSSANVRSLSVALLRGAFEYQGQKCSAASRAYIPDNIWGSVRDLLLADMKTLKIGSPEDLSNFINAVIDEKSFDRISDYIEKARHCEGTEIIAGGYYNKDIGYFIEPTLILTTDPHFITMEEEIFGPVLTVYIYPEKEFDQALELVNNTSPYALTGAIFSQDQEAIEKAKNKLLHAAGNFYINDKPTGAVVNEQPFGGARGSGTNDKAGSVLNLLRWVSPRTIKTNLNPPGNYKYPFLD